MTETSRRMLKCGDIEATTATQCRVRLDKNLIDEYCEDIKNGADFPAVDVFHDGGERWILAGGFHTLLATINAGKDEIKASIHEGGMREALAFAFGDNATNGLRRTSADKRHAIEMALKDPYFGKLDRQEIADLCRVTKRTVQRIANRSAVEDPDSSVNGDDPGEANDAKPDDHRPTKPEPTQAEVETAELRQALSLIRAFPYGGEDAVKKMELTAPDIENLMYVSEWCAATVIGAGS